MRLLLTLLAFAGSLAASQSHFEKTVDRYYNDRFQYFPSEATADGFHQWDAKLEDYSAGARQARVAMDRRYLAEFLQFPATSDRDLMISHINADLLDAEDIRSWERDPDWYSSGVTNSIFQLISRRFASPEDRLQSVISRETQIPQVLVEARRNLKNPPRIYTQVAIEQLPGIVSFFEKDVPAAFTTVRDPSLQHRFQQVNQAAVAALKSYENFLKTDLLNRSRGEFAIGAENYRKKLLYEEMVDIPLDRLLQIGFDNLRENQHKLVEVAHRIDPRKTPQQIAEELENDHPAPDHLLQSFRDTFNGLINFIQQKHIITIPSSVRPTLEETPPFMRALTTASMDTPGPYETKATEAYFNITLPEKTWSPKETQEFMTAFNRGTIVSTAIHEAYPGHYVQLLWFQRVQGKVRKLSQCGSNVEGWAHYTEQMMLDEGYGGNDPKLRLGQLLDALLRNCRYIVGIEMHTGKMTYPQAIDFFVKEGYMSRAYAEREAKRGTSDPTYLVYTLGKLEILKLRADYAKKEGSAFNLEQFHNTFVGHGGIPVKIIRKEMLGNDSPTL